MKLRTKILFILGMVIAIAGSFAAYSYYNFRIDQHFTPVALDFDPFSTTSSYTWKESSVIIQGGFVKGTMKNGKDEELLLRALSPTPKIMVQGVANQTTNLILRIENLNPVGLQVSALGQTVKTIDQHTVSINITLQGSETKTLEFTPKDERDYLEFVILGDNRDGYQTFATIIDQINAENPVMVIDNGDLVYGGEPNRYRLFNETISKLQEPLLTTLGNHDIRENGRPTYTKLFGPPYYSFDYRNTHFVFLDSSRGWTERTSIPEEQYQWLEQDLQKAQGKLIYVVSHIPPTDPRTGQEPNTLPDIPGVQEKTFLEKILSNYSKAKNLDHAFPDKDEAQRFENMMSKYKVNTVFLSHIHSYFSFLKDDVRYIISGGAGAELLTKDSYYHYLRVKVKDNQNYLEVVQLPSPPNQLQDRYLAAIQLFSSALYKEYTFTIWVIGVVISALIVWLLWNTRRRWWPSLKFAVGWLRDIIIYAKTRYGELKSRTGKK